MSAATGPAPAVGVPACLDDVSARLRARAFAGRQRAALRVLAQLLTPDLPPLAWTVAETGHLTGDVGPLPRDNRERVRIWQAWVSHLGATVGKHSGEQLPDGSTHLYALATNYAPGVSVALDAVLSPTDSPDGSPARSCTESTLTEGNTP